MRSDRAAITVLGASAALLGALNLWFTAVRSTIPIALHGTVVEKLKLNEKHPGVDDVHVLRINGMDDLIVDAAVHQQVEVGMSVSKPAWSRTLQTSVGPKPLEWSTDFQGMCWTMTAASASMLMMLIIPFRGWSTNHVQ